MKYLVKVHCLDWYNVSYIIEASSEEEAKDLIEDGEGSLYSDDYDCTDQFYIESIEKI